VLRKYPLRPHNPKVEGSNPSPATNRFNYFHFSILPFPALTGHFARVLVRVLLDSLKFLAVAEDLDREE
jgi:hypothetical protein